MTDDRSRYFARAASWADDTRADAARVVRLAWIVAGIAVAIALFEAVALAMLAPLKTVQPITLLVDRQTGYVQALDPLTPRRVTADAVLTDAYLAQYIVAREGFDHATVALDYRRVALWSAGRARSAYLGQMPAASPASPFRRYPPGTTIQVRVKSVSRLNTGTALVRFDTQQATGSATAPAQPWIAVVRFRYTDAAMRMEDRLVNPLGFQVTGYRRDAEAPPVETATPAPETTPATVIAQRPAPPVVRQVDRAMRAASDTPERREVPINQLPMGSPLSPGGTMRE